ncbi:MAG: hypothetical protein ACREQM_21335, partial [Candidatus Dormibacteraceae bacterium]
LTLVTLGVNHDGSFSFFIVLPIGGLVYGTMTVVAGRQRALGIIGVVLCALALLLTLFLWL